MLLVADRKSSAVACLNSPKSGLLSLPEKEEAEEDREEEEEGGKRRRPSSVVPELL